MASKASAPSVKDEMKREAGQLDMKRVSAAMMDASGDKAAVDLSSLNFGDFGSEKREHLTNYFKAFCSMGMAMKNFSPGGVCEDVRVLCAIPVCLLSCRAFRWADVLPPPLPPSWRRPSTRSWTSSRRRRRRAAR